MTPTTTATPTKECSDDFPDVQEDIQKYRFFNQPIEQIPGWKADKSQILFHTPNKGLYWESVPDQCVEVPKCVKIEFESPGSEKVQIKADKVRIRPLQNLGDLEEPVVCGDLPTEAIDVVTCIKLDGENLVIERKKVLVVKDMGEASTICENIPLVSCEGDSSG
jgi:hypothetical protein